MIFVIFFNRIYNVMIGKISTRKHKQWENDGILEVTGKNAVLKVFFIIIKFIW